MSGSVVEGKVKEPSTEVYPEIGNLPMQALLLLNDPMLFVHEVGPIYKINYVGNK